MYCVADYLDREDRDERLEVFTGFGLSKKAAKEEAARQMALSGHCVSGHGPLGAALSLY